MHVILTGTDPTSRKGGIGFAMPGYLAAIKHAGICYESIPTYHPTAPGGSWWWWMRAIPRLWRHMHATRRSGQQVILYSHAGAGVSLLREGVVLALGRLWSAKTVMQLHAPEIDNYLKSRWTLNLFKLAVSRADCLCILTPWWRERLADAGTEEPIFVIPNPLPKAWEEKARTKATRIERRDVDEMVVLTITRIEPGKGVDLLIEAMVHLPAGVRLVVAGDGSQLAALKQRVSALGLASRVRFVGWVAGDEKQRLLDEADIFCLPTSYDSFGMGFLEAMANGLPIVALNWGPIGDVVPNGRAGILIDEADPERLAAAIQRFMDDPALRKRMGTEGKRWVLERFSAEKVGEELRKMFDAVAQA